MVHDAVNVLILWHMHQPSYRVQSESFRLPWTRLHATKDYLGMARLVQEFPGIQVNFNFTPVLWDQLKSYAGGDLDRELEVASSPVSDLQIEEKEFILEKMFLGNAETLIDPYPRYSSLHQKYISAQKTQPEAVHTAFCDQELRDIIVWRILAWIHEGHTIPSIKHLYVQGRDFTENDKSTAIAESIQLIRTIPGLYKTLQDEGIAEITTTPYFHPILPILMDSESARESLPDIQLPGRFSFPEDAQWHVEAAIESHMRLFGKKPTGLWPAEGSVSKKAVQLFIENNIYWIATDENILAASAGISLVRDSRGQVNHPEYLYRPWKVELGTGKIGIVFRDHLLSDLIGFEYKFWDQKKAVRDFESRLMSIYDRLADKPFSPCVAVILDGENAWEHYPGGGMPFLRELYSTLAANPKIKLRKATDYLQSVEPQMSPLPTLTAGSWINGNFGIWIGNPEENLAWQLIYHTHKILESYRERVSTETYNACRHLIRKAQGSDSFWWYGDDHYTEEKHEFDLLFRTLLLTVYQRLNAQPPETLTKTLISQKSRQFKLTKPKMLISPIIDGKIGRYFDWFGAGSVDFRGDFSAMHAALKPVFKSLKFGFDLQKLYLLLEFGEGFEEALSSGLHVDLKVIKPEPEACIRYTFTKPSKEEIPVTVETDVEIAERFQVKCVDILEIAIPFILLNAKRNELVEFYLEMRSGGRFAGRIPDFYGVSFSVPTEDYDNLMWEV